MLRTCVSCGAEFSTKQPAALTCSVVCQKERNKEYRRNYVRNNESYRESQREYMRKWYSANREYRLIKQADGRPVMRTCEICGAAFAESRLRINALTCSEVCRRLRKHRRRRYKLRGYPPSALRPCAVCGAEFLPKQRQVLTCSAFCRVTYRNERNLRRAKERYAIRQVAFEVLKRFGISLGRPGESSTT